VVRRSHSAFALLLAYLVAGAAAVAAAVYVRQRLPGLHPVLVAAAADLVATVVVFVFSIAFGNSSIYDPYWSIAPVPIALAFFLAGSGGGAVFSAALRPRQVAVLLLLLAWAIRLTANCLARWRGLDHEDWRYAGYRRLRAGYWPVSFFGFHLMPTVLVYLGCLSLWPALSVTGRAPGAVDYVALVLTVLAIGVEGTADFQLQRFLARKGSEKRVIDEGLWRLVRHPNYLGEVLFWWGLWVFGLAADPSWWWTVAGPVAITLMFVFISVPMMDRHLLEGRPGYAKRLRAVPALLPWPRRGP
jgi:steroid 5-alpha reductase family enzyme